MVLSSYNHCFINVYFWFYFCNTNILTLFISRSKGIPKTIAPSVTTTSKPPQCKKNDKFQRQ